MSVATLDHSEISVSYFGLEGSNTHQAAHERFGSTAIYYPQISIPSVFDAVEKGLTTCGIVPFENSTYGSVVTTLDRFVTTEVQIKAETYLPVHHCLLSRSNIKSLRRVYSHPQAFGQCQKWLDANLKEVERVHAGSTSQAAQMAAAEPDAAAIANITCAHIYNLNVLAKDIEDVQGNTTRFFILSKTLDLPTGNDKTLILFTVDHQKPGALCDALMVFKDHNINLTKIDSRPSLQRPWHYVFFVEFCGHKDEKWVKSAIDELRQICLDLTVLGSYQSSIM